MLRSILFWVLAIVLAGGIAIYQRITGPTYPVSGKVNIGNEEISYKLIRTYGKDDDAKVLIPIENENVSGEFHYRRFKSFDKWIVVPMERTDKGLAGFVPHQPPAGKVMYNIVLYHDNQRVELSDEPVIIRFKGHVPQNIVVMHIVFIFLAFIFSMRAGFEALVKGKYTFLYTVITIVTLVLGGLVLGPILQKYAFGEYWTGWPMGHDLTDNKTAFAAIFWFIALFVQIKNRANKKWAAIASFVLLLTYLIPHSVLGSEIDFREKENIEVVE